MAMGVLSTRLVFTVYCNYLDYIRIVCQLRVSVRVDGILTRMCFSGVC